MADRKTALRASRCPLPGGRGAVCALVAVAVSGVVVARTHLASEPALVYHDAVASRDRAVRADLYAPRATKGARAPFVVLVRASDGSDNSGGVAFASALQREGIAVADVACVLGGDETLARCIDDVAVAVRDLGVRARRLGFAAERAALAGFGLGATVAARIALDEALAKRAGLERSRLRGVLAMRGTYDLSDEAIDGHPDRDRIVGGFGDASARAAASPIAHAGADAPPFIVVAAANDPPAWAQIARTFALALDRAGARSVARYVVPGRDGRGLLDLAEDEPFRSLVTAFARAGPAALPLDGPWGVEQIWSVRPPLSSEPFWADERLVVTRPVDERFRAALLRILSDDYELLPYPGRAYQAIPLAAFLDAKGPDVVGRGDWVVLSNVRHERIVLSRSDIDRYQPLIVIGLDGERNLYRLVAWYRMKRAYSWQPDEGPLPTMIRPVGAFLYFPDKPPPEVGNDTYAGYGLLPEGIRVVVDDPLAAVRDVPDDVGVALWGKDACLSCHALRGAGSRAHHVTADRAAPHGAYALPLDEYPPSVLYRFLFDQAAVAASFGVEPLRVPEGTAFALYDLVTNPTESVRTE